MSEEQLEAIRKRTKKTRGNWLTDFNALSNASHVVNEDVPLLIAEVERLQGLLKNGGDDE